MKRYLGDGVYADWDGNQIVLTTENGLSVTNTIYLNSLTFEALIEYVIGLKEKLKELKDDNKASPG